MTALRLAASLGPAEIAFVCGERLVSPLQGSRVSADNTRASLMGLLIDHHGGPYVLAISNWAPQLGHLRSALRTGRSVPQYGQSFFDREGRSPVKT